MDQGLNRGTFREEKLLDQEVNKVLGVNITAIKRVHKLYSR